MFQHLIHEINVLKIFHKNYILVYLSRIESSVLCCTLCLYLNVSLTTENPNVELEEPLNPFSQRPVSVITKETKKILIQLLEECGDFSRQSGYETLLANMGHDLAKGFSVHGYMILLQLMSEGNIIIISFNILVFFISFH